MTELLQESIRRNARNMFVQDDVTSLLSRLNCFARWWEIECHNVAENFRLKIQVVAF